MPYFEKPTELYQRLQKELDRLPGELAHIEMFPLRAKTSDLLKTNANYRLSSVMALLFHEAGKHQIILTERQDYEGMHSGQMSFPGGKKEEFDLTLVDTALRETHEEIGIHPEQIQVIGKLTDVYIPVSNFLVHPYLGFLSGTPTFILNSREVKSVVCFDIMELLKEESKIITDINMGKGSSLKGVPAFCIENKIIWGATALMLNEFKLILNRL